MEQQLCQQMEGLTLRLRDMNVTYSLIQNKPGNESIVLQPKAVITKAAQSSANNYISRDSAIADDSGDPNHCAEYVLDIYRHLLHEERQLYYLVRPKFLGEQLNISAHNRSMLVDWLVQVGEKLQLCNVTLHVTVDVMDRYLQVQQVLLQTLQLVGVASMFLACKYEESCIPSVHDLTYITNDAYTTGEIRSMEMDILKTVDYRMSKPLVLEFLRLYFKNTLVVAIEHHLAEYFLELALLDEALSPVHPSKKAAAALLLARTVHLAADAATSKELTPLHFSGYQMSNLTWTVDALKGVVRSWHSHPTLAAIRHKYAADALGSVSSLPALRNL